MRPLLLATLLLSACTTTALPPDPPAPVAATRAADSPDTSAPAAPSANGNFMVASLPLDDVNTALASEFSQLRLVVSQNRSTAVDGRFEVSSATSSVSIVTTALSPSATRVNIYAGDFVSDGRNQRAADPRFHSDLQAILLSRVALLLHTHPYPIPARP